MWRNTSRPPVHPIVPALHPYIRSGRPRYSAAYLRRTPPSGNRSTAPHLSCATPSPGCRDFAMANERRGARDVVGRSGSRLYGGGGALVRNPDEGGLNGQVSGRIVRHRRLHSDAPREGARKRVSETSRFGGPAAAPAKSYMQSCQTQSLGTAEERRPYCPACAQSFSMPGCTMQQACMAQIGAPFYFGRGAFLALKNAPSAPWYILTPHVK